MNRTPVKAIVAAAFVASVALMQPAHAAYVDPGSGSYFLQIALAGVVGALFSLKLFWTKIKLSISERLGGNRNGQTDERPDQHA